MQDEKQIQSMVDFIERDAHEKARELEDEANAQYNAEKANYVEAEKKKVQVAFEKEKKQVEVNRRVAAAQHSQAQRMRVLDTRRACLDTLEARIRQKIDELVKDERKYKPLLGQLLTQAAVSVRADASVYVRQQDVQMARSLTAAAEEEVFKRAGVRVKLTVESDNYLDTKEHWGGVRLLGMNKQITCENTLANRAKHVFDDQLPTIRYNMFHELAKP